MRDAAPDFSIGIEEEYLLVETGSGALAQAPEALMTACRERLAGQVSPEFLQCQIEVGTKVCADIGEARADLSHLRATVAEIAAGHGLAPIAVSCHPFADWKDQETTDRARYNDLERALAAIARRMLICGMHVHVGVADADMRIDLMNQLSYFLPHLLALSTSSPYWQGVDTGLASYRLSVFDNLPRTGLPPRFASWSEYQRSAAALVDLGLIEDTSKIWWDLRPSAAFPTLETRICDVMPRLEHTLSVAAVIQCLTRMLWRLARRNQRWRLYDQFLISENRWRAQRFGVAEGLIDLGARQIKDVGVLVDEIVELVAEDAEALGCAAEVAALRDIVAQGTGADRQRRVHAGQREAGADPAEAMRAVVAHLAEEFRADL